MGAFLGTPRRTNRTVCSRLRASKASGVCVSRVSAKRVFMCFRFVRNNKVESEADLKNNGLVVHSSARQYSPFRRLFSKKKKKKEKRGFFSTKQQFLFRLFPPFKVAIVAIVCFHCII